MSATKALFDTPHRSVHWTALERLPSTDPDALRKLLTWNVASTSPHVFTTSLSLLTTHAICGTADVAQTTRTLTSFILVPISIRSRVPEDVVVPNIVRNLIRLVVAGADEIMYPKSVRIKDTVMRNPMEKAPGAWQYVFEILRETILVDHSNTSDDDRLGFEVLWDRISRVLKFAIAGQNVPAWAQSSACSLVFELAAGLLSSHTPEKLCVILGWICSDIPLLLPVDIVLETHDGSDSAEYDRNVVGRWFRFAWLVSSSRLVQSIAANIVCGESNGILAVHVSECIEHLRLLLVSQVLAFSSYDTEKNGNWSFAPRVYYDPISASMWIGRLSTTAHSLLSRGDEGNTPACDSIVWAVAASRVTEAASAQEQRNWLTVIDNIVRHPLAFLQIPNQIKEISRLPLIATEIDGFDSANCKLAHRLIDDIFGETDSVASLALESLLECIVTVCESTFVFGDILQFLGDFVAYIETYSKVLQPMASKTNIIDVLEPVKQNPLFVAPFLFEWNALNTTKTSSNSATLAKLALSWLVGLAEQKPKLRLHLLPLMTAVLRHPFSPITLRHAIVLNGIPALVTTHDAYSTARAISVISGLWNRSIARLKMIQDSGNSTQQKEVYSVSCVCSLTVRAWANAVKNNSRVWRDLKPVITQWAESIKSNRDGAVMQDKFGSMYEWAVLTTMRDLVIESPSRYSEQILPIVYSLLTYAHSRLSPNSTALLLDVANASVDAGVVDVRSVWTAIISKVANRCMERLSETRETAVPVLDALSRFYALCATRSEGSELYILFRQEILARYLYPLCGLSKKPIEDSEDEPVQGTEIELPDLVFLPSATRDAYLAALSCYPPQEIMSLISSSTPGQVIRSALSLLTSKKEHQSPGSLYERLQRAGGFSDLISVLMDNEVRFMRRSLIIGTSSQAAENMHDDAGDDVGSGDSRKWIETNYKHSLWLNDAILPALEKMQHKYWNHGALASGLLPGYAMASMIGPSQTAESTDIDNNEADVELQVSESDKLVAQMCSLIKDISLNDHWTIRNTAVDTWTIWFGTTLNRIYSGESSKLDSTVSFSERLSHVITQCEKLVEVLKDRMTGSYAASHRANAILACAGMTKAVSVIDQKYGCELAVLFSMYIDEMSIVPYTMSAEAFWANAAVANEHNEEVLSAGVESIGHLAVVNSADLETTSQIAQFFMSGLTIMEDNNSRCAPIVMFSVTRLLMNLHFALVDDAKLAVSSAHDGEVVNIEADDIRRCVERFDIFNGSGKDGTDLGSIGTAMALATMHRYWIQRLINPGLSEQNAQPRSVQARRVVAQTVRTALEHLKQAKSNDANIPSMFYLAFVWPPKPITQRHVEIYPDIFASTPEHVWRLLGGLWQRTRDGLDKLNSASLDHTALEMLALVEIVYSTLTHNMFMTSKQPPARLAYSKLVHEFSAFVGDESSIGIPADLAADERPMLRASRIVSLSILLGLPLHGVPETSASNAYLTGVQRRSLSVILGIGSVQYGSVGWMRAGDAEIKHPLSTLIECSGILNYLNVGGGMVPSAHRLPEEDQTPSNGTRDESSAEVNDVRGARIASFVLSGLWAQSTRAITLLQNTKINSEDMQHGASGNTGHEDATLFETKERDALSATEILQINNNKGPKSLSRLPAPTSWCRALWDELVTLSTQIAHDQSADSEAYTIQCMLVYLLDALCKMKRPFPIVSCVQVLSNIFGAAVHPVVSSRSQLSGCVEVPSALLLLQAASRQSSISYPMSQLLIKVALQILEMLNDMRAHGDCTVDRRVDSISKASFFALCVESLGLTGIGKILKLSQSLRTAAESSAGRGSRGSVLTSSEVLRLAGSNELCVEIEMAREFRVQSAKEAPWLVVDMENGIGDGTEGEDLLVEDEAARMFRIMSKVAIPKSSVTESLCGRTLEREDVCAIFGG